RVLAADCFPEYAIGAFEKAATPNGDCEHPIRPDQTPKPSDRSLHVRDEKYPEDTEYRVECLIGKRQVFQVGPTKLNICDTLFRSPLGSFTQEFFGEIHSNNLSCRRHAPSGRNGGRTHAATGIQNGHAGSERQTIYGPPTVEIPK